MQKLGATRQTKASIWTHRSPRELWYTGKKKGFITKPYFDWEVFGRGVFFAPRYKKPIQAGGNFTRRMDFYFPK